MPDNCKLRIDAAKAFVLREGSPKDFIETLKKSNTSIKVCKHSLSKSDQEVVFQLVGSGLSISFESLLFPQEDLDAFFDSAKKEGAVITLTPGIDSDGEELLTFEVIFPQN